MTGSNILLDTNIIIEIFNRNKTIADKLNKVSGFFIAAVVLGELYIGINRVSNKSKHIRKLNSFLQLCTILPADRNTAKKYGGIIAKLYKKGKPPPTNDVWIAASAIQHKLILITRDKHIIEIDKLKTKFW